MGNDSIEDHSPGREQYRAAWDAYLKAREDATLDADTMAVSAGDYSVADTLLAKLVADLSPA